jgi:hypothetical protein
MIRNSLQKILEENINFRLVLVALLLSIMVLISYRGAYDNEFVDWDDYTYVIENDLVRNPEKTTLKEIFSTPVSLNYHPLTILSMRMNNNECKTCTEGISAAPFIKWNVVIHLLNTILVFLLIFKLSEKKILVAFITAALFGVHPMHVESVAWVSERKDVLYTFFFLSGLIAYNKYLTVTHIKNRKYIWLTATFLLFILSCLSKAMAVVFPLTLILINFWLAKPNGNNQIKESLREAFSKRRLIPLIPFFAFSIFFGVLAISINNLNSFTVGHRIQYASYGFIMYIVKFLVPANLVAIYPYPTAAEYTIGTFGTLLKLSPFVFITILGLVIYSMRKNELFGFGIGFFLITVMMVLQFISVGAAIMADRYSYLCYVGLAFIPAMLIGDTVTKKQIPLFIVTAGFIITMIVVTQKQIKVWQNSETLWTKVIDLYPSQETPRSIRGIYYSKKSAASKDANEKRKFEEKALEDFKVAINANTPRADVYEGAGNLYGKRGDFNNSLLCLNKAIQLKPRKGSNYFNRGLTLSMLNRNEEAIKDYTIALVYSPEMAVAILTNRSNLYISEGRFREAILDFDYLISTNSRNFIYYYDRALAKHATNDISGAMLDYKKALELQPDDQLTKDQIKRLTGK